MSIYLDSTSDTPLTTLTTASDGSFTTVLPPIFGAHFILTEYAGGTPFSSTGNEQPLFMAPRYVGS